MVQEPRAYIDESVALATKLQVPAYHLVKFMGA
jgi:hypothetical protein